MLTQGLLRLAIEVYYMYYYYLFCHVRVFLFLDSFVERHLPWGVPMPLRESVSTSCVLTQEGFITGYSSTFRIPRWVAYRLDGKVRNPLLIFCSLREGGRVVSL